MKYYIINLEERTDRKKQITENMEKFKLDYHIFKAIKPTVYDILNNDMLDPLQFKFFKNFRFYKDRKYAIGSSGCKLSHYKLLEYIKKNDENEYSIILEDDCVLVDDFQIHLNKSLKFIKKNNIDFNLLYLGCNIHSRDSFKVIDKTLLQCELNKCFCTHSILIKNNNIDIILNHIKNSKKEIDETYLTLPDRYIVYPLLTYQTYSNSDISDIKFYGLMHKKIIL